MAWNQPGGSGDKDPWGKGRRDQGPPDLDQILRNLSDKLRAVFGGGPGGGDSGAGLGASLILIAIAVMWLASGAYVVAQGERGILLRFGAFDPKSGVTDAGLHWHWPFPIERVEKVNVEQVSSLEIGYRRDERTGGSSKVPKEALMLTEDENIIDIEFAVQYKVKDAGAYLFNVRDPERTIREATESAVREMVGKSTLDFVITEGREEVAQKTRVLLQDILDRYNTGIYVVLVQMQKAQPPQEVKPAFDDAVKAREDEQRFKSEAEAYANDMIPRARGGAARLEQEAQAYKAATIARAEGDAYRFSQIVAEYAKAPAVTRQRLYIEAMEKVLSSTTKVMIDQKGGNNILYLPLDKMLNQSVNPAGATGPVTTMQPLAEPTDGRAGVGGRDRGSDSSRSRGIQ